jgi:hypothetical protein
VAGLPLVKAERLSAAGTSVLLARVSVEAARITFVGVAGMIALALALGPWIASRMFAKAVVEGRDRAAGFWGFVAAGGGSGSAGRVEMPSAPRNRGETFTYRLHLKDGSDVGEATYAQMIHVGEQIIADQNQHFRVLDVVSFEEEDESPFVGLLQVEAA